jgi:hypothetical protein
VTGIDTARINDTGIRAAGVGARVRCGPRVQVTRVGCASVQKRCARRQDLSGVGGSPAHAAHPRTARQ